MSSGPNLQTAQYASNVVQIGPGFPNTALPSKEVSQRIQQAVSQIRVNQLIPLRYGEGKRVVVMTSALDCPYCARLENTLEQIGEKLNLTVYVIPLLQNPSNKVMSEKTLDAWCSADPGEAWRKAWRREPLSTKPARGLTSQPHKHSQSRVETDLQALVDRH